MPEKKIRLSRRAFLKAMTVGAAGGAVLGGAFSPAGTSVYASAPKTNGTGIAGVICVSSQANKSPRLDFISLTDGRRLGTLENTFASHAIVPVESTHSFFVHGRDTQTDKGVIRGFAIDPVTAAWNQIYEKQLEGGLVLHWQPSPDGTLIQYNTIKDHALHVLDTRSLELHTYQGGGSHSNMAFFHDNDWLVATDDLGRGTKLRVVARATNTILSETAVGNWGHGLTVNDETGRAFVWADEGVHIVSLAKMNLGAHLGLIKTAAHRQRSWFCWTPQGGRYSHDQTWNPGDRYSPWLTVLDMQKARLERIETGPEQPGILQISPDGKLGVSGSHASNNICLFDIAANRFLGTVAAGGHEGSFFDRDVGFSRDRRIVFVTNPADKTLTAIDVHSQQAIGQIALPAKPEWMKVLTV